MKINISGKRWQGREIEESWMILDPFLFGVQYAEKWIRLNNDLSLLYVENRARAGRYKKKERLCFIRQIRVLFR